MKAYWAMLRMEIRLSIRDMNMVAFALVMPAAVLLILGALYGGDAAEGGGAYTFMEQSFGALCAISICAGGVMGLPLVVSEYRERGILRRLWATPATPVMLLAVQLTIYALYAMMSAAVLALLGRVCFGMRLRGSLWEFAGAWLLTLACMLSIGMLVGGTAKDSKQASLIASLLYFPMLLFSGTTIPYEVMPAAMRRAADVMPLTQGIKLMKGAFVREAAAHAGASAAMLGVLAVICASAAVCRFRWEA